MNSGKTLVAVHKNLVDLVWETLGLPDEPNSDLIVMSKKFSGIICKYVMTIMMVIIIVMLSCLGFIQHITAFSVIVHIDVIKFSKIKVVNYLSR